MNVKILSFEFFSQVGNLVFSRLKIIDEIVGFGGFFRRIGIGVPDQFVIESEDRRDLIGSCVEVNRIRNRVAEFVIAHLE
ncbi:hypothetical protein DLM77_06950 [Leptospira yasudae]|uniref:Uncharacterized protein n=1 Tax=Leptospira yasudae TaxID=2202201 RepID=A0ABX9M5K1_9LEPT|nr:hypothetical protein DLM77_06950 [Leptospira yasudae]